MQLKIEQLNGQKKDIEYQMLERIGLNYLIYMNYIKINNQFMNLDKE